MAHEPDGIVVALVESMMASTRSTTDHLIEMGLEAQDRYHALENAVHAYADAQDSRTAAHELYELVSHIRNVPMSQLRGAE